MAEIKIFTDNIDKKMTKIKSIYKAFGLRYDVREARKFLELPKTTPKKQVNAILKAYYQELEDDLYEPLFSYTLTGNVINLVGSGFKQKAISSSFQSTKIYKLYPMNILGDPNLDITFNNNYPTYTLETIPEKYEAIIMDFMSKSTIMYGAFTIENITKRKIPKKKGQLKDVPLYKCVVNVPYKDFNGFKDTGNMLCVPETLLHHLQINGRNKKLKINHIIDKLEEEYDDIDDNMSDDGVEFDDDDMNITYQFEKEEGESECPDEEEPDYGKRGYTSIDIIRVLEFYECRGRLMNVHQKEFTTTNFDLKYDKNLLSFCGMVYGGHLYYCDNQKFVTSISNSRANSGFQAEIYEKKNNKKTETKYDIIEESNLTNLYIEMFKQDNTIKLVRTLNSQIVSINDNDKIIYANPDKTIMTEILGDDFVNQNTTTLGEKEFKEYFPQHKTSSFTKDVFDKLQKHGNIVESFNEPLENIQFEYDINKCRTHCWLNNKLGDYEVFGVSSQIEDYEGNTLRAGIYYVELVSLKDREFFMRGNTWYSKQFIEYGLKEGYNVNIKYQLLAKEVLDKDYFKPFVNSVIKKYPKYYKDINNKCIGYRGKTVSKVITGYIETDFNMAVNAYWDNNEDKIGFIDDENIEQKKWKLMKGKLCNIHGLKIDDETTHYIVETEDFKTLYENDLPIFNKILENEFLNVYELKKKLGGRLIKIKTDAVVIEGDHNKIKLSNEIGGIKMKKEYDTIVNIKHIVLDNTYTVDTSLNWNTTYEQEDGSIYMPNGSVLITGEAGFGKSYYVKSLPEYSEEKTLRLAFTNIATLNISDEEHPANTLNSYFGINCITGKCCEKKIKNLKNIDTIIISEIFMTPSYLMGYLSKIKHQFSHIKFICEGDNKQTRPVGEEKTDWLNTQLLLNICGGNRIVMTINKRNNETENYNIINDGKELDDSKYSNRESQIINICRTNAMRVTINNIMMNKNDYFVGKNRKNDKSQDIYITKDTPIMCIKNNKKMDIYNGGRYNITQLEKDNIIINDKMYSDVLFSEHFVVCYAMTNHKIQGLTIKENFNIYDWGKMSIREKYTAYSRTSDGENVKINRDFKPDYELYHELMEYFGDYSKAKVYIIKCQDKVYIGSTIKSLEERFKEHKAANNRCTSKILFQLGEPTIELLEAFSCDNKSELLKREGELMSQYPNRVNKLIPGINQI